MQPQLLPAPPTQLPSGPVYRAPGPEMPPPEVSASAAWSYALSHFSRDSGGLVLGAVMTLIPLLGPVLLNGWQGEVVAHLRDNAPGPPPKLDFERFSVRLEKGLPGFLVQLVWGMGFGVLFTAAAFALGFSWSLLSQLDSSALLFAVTSVLVVATLLAFSTLRALANIGHLRADLAGDAAAAWDFSLLWDELRRTRGVALRAWGVHSLFALALTAVGLLFFCVGVYAVLPVTTLAATHLRWQLHLRALYHGARPVLPALPPAAPPTY